MNNAELQQPDLCVIGLDRAGLEIAFSAAGLGVPVTVVTQSEAGQPIHPAVAAVLARLTALGARVVEASGAFIDRRRLAAGAIVIRARRFVIATGAVPRPSPLAGIANLPAWSGEKTAKLLVLGGSASCIGLAQQAQQAGADVTLVVDGPVLPDFDAEAVGILRGRLQGDGIVIHEHVDFSKAGISEPEGGGYAFHLANGEAIPFTHYRQDSGSLPLIEGLDLARAGIASRDGCIVLSPSLRTSNRRVYAAGTVTLRPGAGRHASTQASAILGEILFRRTANLNPHWETRHVEAAPAIAEVGIGESEFAAKDRARFRFYRTPLVEVAGVPGHIKVIAAPGGEIRGVSIIAPNAAELIVPFTQAMIAGQTLGMLARIPIASPGQAAAVSAVAKLWLKDRIQSPLMLRLMRILRIFG